MSALKRNEIFHLVIFAGVFLYFIVLKMLGVLTISWTAMLVPLYVFAFLYILIKLLKHWHCKHYKK